MQRPLSSKTKIEKKLVSKVRFPDQVVLLESIKDSDVENVKSLLRRRSACIDMTLINNSGLTAFHHAVLENSIDLVKLMIENNAEINCVDEDHWTPLHTAASLGYHEISRLLLQNGADWKALTWENQTPFDLIDSNDIELKNLYLKYMTEPEIPKNLQKSKTNQKISVCQKK
ncbi:unnamed protein product [Brachionus calyciflorus]|uniref:Uncharacterized protein n=1 Tax=Brachionus calyciflorus TaxID=104777 RepID=A0A813PCP4_9BILA|nr:unnamed protein product [Brachionus calyciflorus]